MSELGDQAQKSPKKAVEAFIASMVWGFGRTGYGVLRTNRILSANPDAPEKLHHVAKVLAAEGPVEGYRAMANDDRLKWLGPAFGTKFLHYGVGRVSWTPDSGGDPRGGTPGLVVQRSTPPSFVVKQSRWRCVAPTGVST